MDYFLVSHECTADFGTSKEQGFNEGHKLIKAKNVEEAETVFEKWLESFKYDYNNFEYQYCVEESLS